MNKPRHNKKLDSLAKRGISEDKNLKVTLRASFSSDTESAEFIKLCLMKLKTRRMLLRLEWFSEIADKIDLVRRNRPALQIIFLMAMAEGITSRSLGKRIAEQKGSEKTIIHFFKSLQPEDQVLLIRCFRRALLRPRTPQLRVSSIARILYQVRNEAVHGSDFWSFGLSDRQENRLEEYALLTEGYLGKKGRKRRVPLEVNLTYRALRDIFVRTAVSLIKKEFAVTS